jgi:hypothetical protein
VSRSTFEPTCAFRGGQCLRDERLAATGAASVANAPKPDAQIIIASHDAPLRNVRVELMLCEVSECAPRGMAAHIVCRR